MSSSGKTLGFMHLLLKDSSTSSHPADMGALAGYCGDDGYDGSDEWGR